jgi:lysine 6-dehydrogenase
MKKITVLGAGMVGSAIAIDLQKKYEVSVVDKNKNNLEELKGKYQIKGMEADLSDPNAVAGAIQNADLVIGAVPGFMGFEILKLVIEEGKNVVDISFFEQDAFLLDELAKEKNVTAVVDCGVAPGLSNIILGYYNRKININSFSCYVGGLPKKRSWPFQYKAPFSPIDVIEEYTRPARLVENGQIVIKPALSERELIEIDPVGTLEAFNSDGLRSLLRMKIPNMKEKTLRFPGHIDYINVFKEAGFFNDDLIDVNGVKVKPIDLTSKLIFPLWKLEKGEEEFTIMKMELLGTEKGEDKVISFLLYDEYDRETEISSMARTTGYTCTAVANLLLEGLYDRKGINPPEYLGEEEECYAGIMNHLEERGINLIKNESSN